MEYQVVFTRQFFKDGKKDGEATKTNLPLHDNFGDAWDQFDHWAKEHMPIHLNHKASVKLFEINGKKKVLLKSFSVSAIG